MTSLNVKNNKRTASEGFNKINNNSNIEDKERLKNIVKLVQKSYSQFEKGEIDQKGLNKIISNVIKLF
jgi:hypothetical protein